MPDHNTAGCVVQNPTKTSLGVGTKSRTDTTACDDTMKITPAKRKCTGLDVVVFVAFVGLGLGSWIAVNGIFQELPVVAVAEPTLFNISTIYSYAALLVAGGNVYPLIYLLLLGLLPCFRRPDVAPLKRRVEFWVTMFVVFVLGAASCASLAGLWDSSSTWFYVLLFQVLAEARFFVAFLCLCVYSRTHRNISVSRILSLTWHRATPCHMHGSNMCVCVRWQAAGADCMTSVLFYPLCASFPAIFVTALVIGETGTSVVAAAVAASQQDGMPWGQVRFSPDIFFGVLAAVCVLSGLCGVLLYSVLRRYDAGDDGDKHQLELLLDEGDAQTEGSKRIPKHNVAHTGGGPSSSLFSKTRLVIVAAQAAVAFVENGILASVLPNTLFPYASASCPALR